MSLMTVTRFAAPRREAATESDVPQKPVVSPAKAVRPTVRPVVRPVAEQPKQEARPAPRREEPLRADRGADRHADTGRPEPQAAWLQGQGAGLPRKGVNRQQMLRELDGFQRQQFASEARKIVMRYEGRDWPDAVLFETGYGPSGLPHIGTFGEVARTTMVRHAFRILTEDKVATRLLCFSDDMDGMRKIPDNVPDRSALEPYLHQPLTVVPNPFGGDYESFGHHNNAMLRRFLDTFGFDYEFASATDYYKSGRFDEILKRVAERYDDIMAIMLPSLGPERRATYSPFLPISPKTGRVLYVPMKKVNAEDATITFDDEDDDQ